MKNDECGTKEIGGHYCSIHPNCSICKWWVTSKNLMINYSVCNGQGGKVSTDCYANEHCIKIFEIKEGPISDRENIEQSR